MLYSKDDAGTETVVTGGGGGGAVATETIWDAKGDLAVGTGSNTAAELTVGTDGYVLTADSPQSTGLKWAAAATGSAGLDLQNRLDWYDDFIGGLSTASNWVSSLSGSGAAAVGTAAAGRYGTVDLSTGTTAGSFAFLGYSVIPTTTFAPYVLGTEILTVEARISVSDANSSTHQYETYIGMLDNIGAGADGVTVGSTWNGSADVWFIRRVVAGTVYTTNASSGPTRHRRTLRPHVNEEST